MKVDKMTIKITLAVFLSLVLGKVLGLESPFYAGIAAAITLQSRFLDTLAAIKNRISGTIVGIVIGMTFAHFGGGSLFACLIGVFTTTTVCQTLKLEKSISIACIVFLALNVNFYGTVDASFYSTYRLIDTTVGVLVVIAVQSIDLGIARIKEKNSLAEEKSLEKAEEKNHHIKFFHSLKKSA